MGIQQREILTSTGATPFKAEDAAHANGDEGVMLLAVRKDTAAALAGADGDYIPVIVDASGRLHVSVGTLSAAQLPATLGQKTMTASLPVVIASDQSAVAVSAAQLPTAIGQKTKTTALGVTLASDEDALAVTSAPPAAIFSGVKAVTTAGTDEVLAASQALAVGVRVKAHLVNTGTIYVGPENVAAATGYRLLAGDEVFLPVDNLADVWLDASVSAEGVSYVAS